jgi:hypothetical protein
MAAVRVAVEATTARTENSDDGVVAGDRDDERPTPHHGSGDSTDATDATGETPRTWN